jgi:hypothetical protein
LCFLSSVSSRYVSIENPLYVLICPRFLLIKQVTSPDRVLLTCETITRRADCFFFFLFSAVCRPWSIENAMHTVYAQRCVFSHFLYLLPRLLLIKPVSGFDVLHLYVLRVSRVHPSVFE